MPKCSICIDDNIDTRNKCYKCKKSVCNSCYSKMGDLKFDLSNNIYTGKEILIWYKCPFCRNGIHKDIFEIQENICKKILLNNYIDTHNNYIDEITIFKNEISEERFYNKIYKKKLQAAEDEIHRLKGLKDIIVDQLIADYEKKGRKTIKLDELKNTLLKNKLLKKV